MSELNGSKPTFDLSRLSWKDSKEISRNQIRLRRAQEGNDLEALDAAFESMEAYLAKTVTHVPQDWLTPDAPADLDWSDFRSFDWLRQNGMGRLTTALNEAQSPEETTKN